jgi:hypothetical protein
MYIPKYWHEIGEVIGPAIFTWLNMMDIIVAPLADWFRKSTVIPLWLFDLDRGGVPDRLIDHHGG